MPIQLKPSLLRLETLEAIKKTLLVPATELEVKLNTLTRQADKQIEEVRRVVYGDGGKGQLQPTRATANFQPIPAISKIRKQVEDSGRQMVLDLNALAEMAVLMAERHWSIRGCLRLAKPNGLPQATALRAQYAEILEKAGTAELAAWAQTAIDSADPVMFDAVVRENDARKRDERSFLSPGALELFGANWEEYKMAQAMFTEVTLTAKRGALVYAEFEKGRGAVATNRIALGLAVANKTYDINDAGEIVIGQHDDNAQRMNAVGAAVRAKAVK